MSQDTERRRLREAVMSDRAGIFAGMLGCLALAITALPVLAAEGSVPSEQDMGQAVRPAPKGLGTHQGLPTFGTAPSANENPIEHGASISSTPSKHKRVATEGTTSHGNRGKKVVRSGQSH